MGRSITHGKCCIPEYSWARWIEGPRRGPAANRNKGATIAKGEWLVFTDDDCIPDDGWLAAYAQSITTHPSTLIFEGRVYVDRPRKSLAESSPVNDRGGCLWSCNFAIRAELFRQIKGFDERFRYAAMEDVELATRLRKGQNSWCFVAEAAVCHPWREAGGWNHHRRHAEATFTYLSIHPEQAYRLNSRFYVRCFLRAVCKDTIPDLIRLRGAGMKAAILELAAHLRMTVLMLIRLSGKSSK